FQSHRILPVLRRTHHLAVEAVHDALAGEGHQLHRARLPGLETHRRAGRNVEPKAARRIAIEREGAVGLEEMKMRADLDRAVAGVGNGERNRGSVHVQLDLAGAGDESAWNHPALNGWDRARSRVSYRREMSLRPGCRESCPRCPP